MTDLAYVSLSVAAPLVWALVLAVLFRRIDARRGPPDRGDRPPAGDYSI